MNIIEKLSTANAVWIATALLHKENEGKNAFQIKEIFEKVKKLDLLTTQDSTLSMHISLHCVANAKAAPDTHKKLFRVSSGWYRLFREGDSFHESRVKGKIEPLPEMIPQQYRYLIDWYKNEYAKSSLGSNSSFGQPKWYSLGRIESGNQIKIPKDVLEKLQVQEGDFVVFSYLRPGEVSLKIAKIKLE